MIDGQHVQLRTGLTRAAPLGGEMHERETVGAARDRECELVVAREPIEGRTHLWSREWQCAHVSIRLSCARPWPDRGCGPAPLDISWRARRRLSMRHPSGRARRATFRA